MPIAFGGRKVVVIAQSFAVLASGYLLFIVGGDRLTYPLLVAYAVLMGIAQAFATPARDGLLNDVAEGRLQRTVMLTSIMQFGLQMVGFMVASLSDRLGPESHHRHPDARPACGCVRLRPDSRRGKDGCCHTAASVAVRDRRSEDGFFGSPSMRVVMIQNVAMALFFMGSYIVTMPILVREVFQGSAQDLAFMNGANSLGLVSTILLLLRLGDVQRQGRALLLSQGIGAVVLAGAAVSAQLFPVGAGTVRLGRLRRGGHDHVANDHAGAGAGSAAWQGDELLFLLFHGCGTGWRPGLRLPGGTLRPAVGPVDCCRRHARQSFWWLAWPRSSGASKVMCISCWMKGARRCAMAFELAADIGGTFTDVVLKQGETQTAIKVLTTYDDPAEGVMQGIDAVIGRTGLAPADCRVMLHGTTLATNALIERRGAVTALFTTEGHRDAVEMALENRFEQYDVNIDRPLPLVPRPLRLPVVERLGAQGEVLKPFDADSVLAAVPRLEAAGVDSIAIGLLHSYANGQHEQLVAEVLARALPHVSISLSSEVCPEIREYERLSTTCANAYVKPLMDAYLSSLEQKFRARGFDCPVLLMTSGGGLTSLATAREFPIRLVESGPAGGAILAGEVARAGGYRETLSFDMGGTTAKLCVIDDGQPLLSRSFEVDRSYRFKKGSGLPVRIPVIEMVEIGAGGGSIAWVDDLGRLQVGPESAGSEPGPVCYDLGGSQPAVTDADLLLGKLDPSAFAGGRMVLNDSAAGTAMQTHIAEPLSAHRPEGEAHMDAVQAAFGVSEVVNENMAAAARAHLGEWGRGAAGRTLIAFGGAAPLHACTLASKLKIDRVVIPVNAGVGSAVGFLLAPVGFEVVRSHYMTLDALDQSVVAELMAEMYAEARSVIGNLVAEEELQVRRRAFMRYQGQGYEIAVDLDEAVADLTDASLTTRFEENYQRLYGRTIPGLPVEILSWTLNLVAMTDAGGLPVEQVAKARRREPEAVTVLFDPVAGKSLEAGCYERAALQPGDYLPGPALIREEQTTVVVASGFTACTGDQGSLILEKERT